MKKIFLILTFLLSWSICLAEIPHVLKNGDTVDANQLNENFEYLESLSLSDTTGGFLPTYANGVLIGKSNVSYYNTSLTFNSDFEPITLLKTGEIEIRESYFQQFMFINPDCTGDPYIQISEYPVPEDYFLFPPLKGRIYRAQPSGTLYYYPPKVQTMYAKIPLSYLNIIGHCNDYIVADTQFLTHIETGQTYGFPPGSSPGHPEEFRAATEEEINVCLTIIMIKLLPNDPAITGLPNAPFPTPITIDGINEAVIIQE